MPDNMSRKLNNYELQYYGQILAVGEPEDLLNYKAELVMNNGVCYPEGLKIISPCGLEWIFDKVFTSYTASVYLADVFLQNCTGV